MSDDFKTVIVARFQAVPTRQAEEFKWPRWISGLPLRWHERAPKDETAIPPIVTRFRDGISLIKLPDQVTAGGLKCIDAFRYWQHAGEMSQATILFMFVESPSEGNADWEMVFSAFCRRRLFMKAKIFDHPQGDHIALMLDVPYPPFRPGKSSPRFRWWMTIENGKFVPKTH